MQKQWFGLIKILRLVSISRKINHNLEEKNKGEKITGEKIIPELNMCQSSHYIHDIYSDYISCYRNIFFI